MLQTHVVFGLQWEVHPQGLLCVHIQNVEATLRCTYNGDRLYVTHQLDHSNMSGYFHPLPISSTTSIGKVLRPQSV